MTSSRLIARVFAMLIVVFGITMAATAISSAWAISSNLTLQYLSKGTAIAESIAGACVEILLNRDVSTVQATVDQFLEIEGVSYVFVVDAQGEIIAHTFVPAIPEVLLESEAPGPKTISRRMNVPGQGNFIDVSSPILVGQAGHVHVGMDQSRINAAIRSAILKQLALVGIIFALSLLISFFFTNKLVQPLNRLAEYANRVASGTASAEIEVESGLGTIAASAGNDEVGKLARAFQHMVQKISERERSLHERSAQLESTNNELEAFCYSVSHDLRAPLRGIDGFSQALLEDYADKLDDTGRNYLRRVCAGSQRMGQIIDDLLKLSRLGRAEIQMQTVNLSAVAKAIAEDLQAADPSRKVNFAIAENVSVEADGRLLRIVLENLLGNAWKYTSKHPEARIEFGTAAHDGKNSYFVRDDGAGFDMAFASKLYGVFQRLHGANEFAGTGIGLAIVQRIIHRHNGEVWAEGKLERGATFYFTL